LKYPSIAEINAGILCNCIPVAFVLFKGMTEKAITWANHFRDSSTRGCHKTPDSNNASIGQANDYLQDQAQYIPNLPQVIHAAMTGALSILERFRRSKAEKTQAYGYPESDGDERGS
jgi:hypothetical protein